MKRTMMIILAVVMVFTLCIGTAFAKNTKTTTTNKGKAVSTVQKAVAKGLAKQQLKNAYKAAVAPYLAKIKANKKLWGQAAGLENLYNDIGDTIEDLLKSNIALTDAQLAAINLEIGKIKTLKAALKTDKAAMNKAWKAYIKSKKTYDINAATTNLQKFIDLQIKMIDERKAIFASMNAILTILKEAINNPVPEPSPEPSPEPGPTASPAAA